MQNGQSTFEAQWQAHLAGHPFWRDWAGASPESFALVAETLRTPGKRLRPMLFGLACRAFGREPFPGLMPAAMALELAHNFILIHDDLMDRSETRRGAPTLPWRMKALLAGHDTGGFRGEDLALVTGDLLYTMAIESLLRVDAPPAQITAALQVFMQAAMDTGRGALMEIRAAQTPLDELSPAAIESVYALKTGCYSFALPMQLASIFAAAPGDFSFSEFGRHAGIAYQLKNDRDSLQVWLDDGPLPDDLRDGRHTWAVVHAWRAGGGALREALTAPPGQTLRDGLRAVNVIEAMEAAMQSHSAQALQLVKDADIQAFLKDTFGLSGNLRTVN